MITRYFCLLVFLCFIGCSDDELSFDETYTNMKQNHVGLWEVEQNRKQFNADTLTSNYDFYFDIRLNADGYGIVEDPVFNRFDTFEWYLEPFPETLILIRAATLGDSTLSGPFYRSSYSIIEREQDFIHMESKFHYVNTFLNDTSYLELDRKQYRKE